LNWPIGMGRSFRGVVDLQRRDVVLFSNEGHGERLIAAERLPLDDAERAIGSSAYANLREELELVETAGDPYDHEAFLAGEVSPVFWGSAMTNFGIEPLLG